MRDQVYGYELDLRSNWTEEGPSRYVGPGGAGEIVVLTKPVDEDTGLNQYARQVRDNVRMDWWDSASLFEIGEFERVTLDDQFFYRIDYRVQESSDACILAVIEYVGLADDLPDQRVGFRARGQSCEWRQLRSIPRILSTFRLTVEPSSYYTQFIDVGGTTVKANSDVDPMAMYRAAEIVDAMTQGRADIPKCLAAMGVGLAIIPEKDWVTSLPEFRYLSGELDPDGIPYDGFYIRGLGAVEGLPDSATAEENLLRRPRIHDTLFFVDVTIHEFAHAIENLCFSRLDQARLGVLYHQTIESRRIASTYAATNEDEFFAVFTTVYFNATTELASIADDQADLEEEFLPIYQFLWEIYGTVDTKKFARTGQ